MRAGLGALAAEGEGVWSGGELRGYAGRVVGDLSLAVDGAAVGLRVVSVRFRVVGRMWLGWGEIAIELEARVAEGGMSRRLMFENRHQRGVSAYLVNALVPRDPEVRIGEQRRNLDQSRYEVEYTQGRALSGAVPVASWSTVGFWVGVKGVGVGVWGVVVLRRRWAVRAADTAGKPAR
jgi:hypothetical protein